MLMNDHTGLTTAQSRDAALLPLSTATNALLQSLEGAHKQCVNLETQSFHKFPIDITAIKEREVDDVTARALAAIRSYRTTATNIINAQPLDGGEFIEPATKRLCDALTQAQNTYQEHSPEWQRIQGILVGQIPAIHSMLPYKKAP